MCSKPEPTTAYKDLSDLVEQLVGETANTHPAHGYGWAGVRTFYGLLENV